MNNAGVSVYEKECLEMKMILRGIAHEMGNALTVMGYSIKNFGKRQDIKQDENWEYINEDYNYICKLFKDLSEYNNSRELTLNRVDLNILVGNIIGNVENEYKEKGISINYSSICDAYISGDEIKLRQVFVNIIKNAYEAICVSDKMKNGVIEVSIAEGNGYYNIGIKDNGCGIKKENISKVFEPMFTSGKESGTGLGLYICKNVIESHGGTIQVHSEYMKQTIINIKLKKMLS